MIDLGSKLLTLIKTNPELSELNDIAVLQRFIKEQAVFNEEKQTWEAKANKDIAADSVQSAHDPDVTYRKKGAKKHVGLVLNLTETCADENPAQIITDYTVQKAEWATQRC